MLPILLFDEDLTRSVSNDFYRYPSFCDMFSDFVSGMVVSKIVKVMKGIPPIFNFSWWSPLVLYVAYVSVGTTTDKKQDQQN
ncbi:MAG: hypothetical protein HWN68_17945 [Desulfobacterales bacterium]|nr:hypothetical protein [Desulfobacterales bacterium]